MSSESKDKLGRNLVWEADQKPNPSPVTFLDTVVFCAERLNLGSGVHVEETCWVSHCISMPEKYIAFLYSCFLPVGNLVQASEVLWILWCEEPDGFSLVLVTQVQELETWTVCGYPLVGMWNFQMSVKGRWAAGQFLWFCWFFFFFFSGSSYID